METKCSEHSGHEVSEKGGVWVQTQLCGFWALSTTSRRSPHKGGLKITCLTSDGFFMSSQWQKEGREQALLCMFKGRELDTLWEAFSCEAVLGTGELAGIWAIP